MPHYWIVYETNDDLQRLISDGRWADFKQKVYDDMEAKGLGLDDVWFEAEGSRAFALIHSGESKAGEVKELVGRWDVKQELELLTVEEMVNRKEPGRPPKPRGGDAKK